MGIQEGSYLIVLPGSCDNWNGGSKYQGSPVPVPTYVIKQPGAQPHSSAEGSHLWCFIIICSNNAKIINFEFILCICYNLYTGCLKKIGTFNSNSKC